MLRLDCQVLYPSVLQQCMNYVFLAATGLIMTYQRADQATRYQYCIILTLGVMRPGVGVVVEQLH
jgi:hypothetical protein